MKKVFAALTAAVLTMLLAGPMFEADELYEQDTYGVPFYEAEYPTGGAVLPEVTEVTEEEMEAICRTAELNEAALSAARPKRAPARSAYNHSSDYYYNQIRNDTERAIYEGLIEKLENTLNSPGDIEVDTTNGEYVIGVIDCGSNSGITVNEAKYAVYAAYYSNPKYFFFSGSCYYYSNSSTGYVTKIMPYIIPEFADGAKRMEYKNKIEELTNEWMPRINACKTNAEKEMMIARLLAGHIKYIKGGDTDQTIAGALVEGQCVCNGYGMAMTYFCNAARMDCFLAVSLGHAWNFIDVDGNGSYCEVDVTWMDDSGNQYSCLDVYWFNKSHDTFMARDDNGSHIYETGTHDAGGILELPVSCDYVTPCPESEHAKLSDTFGTLAVPCMEKYVYIPACPICYYSQKNTAYYHDPKPHDYENGKYETAEETHTAYCAYGCGNHKEAEPHSFADGVCSLCGYAGSVYGDVNKDGRVDGRDLTALAEYLSGGSSDPDHAYDVNGDGDIDSIDVLELRAILAAAA